MIRIKKVRIENYRGIKSDEFEPADGGLIFDGQNGIGKTSRIEAIYWCLTGVLFDNSSKGITHKIKTLKTGKRMPLSVELELIDEYGEKFFIQKTLTEKWITKDATDIEMFDGDDTAYFINGQKYIKKDYDAIVDRIFGIAHIKQEALTNPKYEYLKKVDWFNLLTNPSYFKKLDKKTQREILIFTVGDYDVMELEMSDSCRTLLENSTIDAVKKHLKDTIKYLGKNVEINTVKMSTLKNDVLGLVCKHCGEPIEIESSVIDNLQKQNNNTMNEMVHKETLLAEIETLEIEYLELLNQKVFEAFWEYARVDIIDENMNPTVKILLKDYMGQWVDMDNGINTGDGMLRLAVFMAYMKLMLKVPSSILFFDSLESLDKGNLERLLGIDEQIFGTQVITHQKGLHKRLIGRNKMEAIVHEI